jgi:DNA-binding NarL/FixJ family response regulator
MTDAPFRTVLADDVFDLRFMVKLALERSGRFVVVAEAENGDEAVEMAREHQPDLVLLDVSMPVKDGLEALPDIRKVSPAAKIVMLSGFEAARLASTALEAGASAYLEKGIPPRELVDELLKVLDPDAPSDNGRATA